MDEQGTKTPRTDAAVDTLDRIRGCDQWEFIINHARQLELELASQQSAVPREPTMGMWDDFCAVVPVRFDQFLSAYRAMVTGLSTRPTQQADVGDRVRIPTSLAEAQTMHLLATQYIDQHCLVTTMTGLTPPPSPASGELCGCIEGECINYPKRIIDNCRIAAGQPFARAEIRTVNTPEVDSRSRLKRMAIQSGAPAPTFESAAGDKK